MSTQLILLDQNTADWQLDEQTRTIGFKGVAQARAALEATRRRLLESDTGQANRSTGRTSRTRSAA